jgi:hypothetical protein
VLEVYLSFSYDDSREKEIAVIMKGKVHRIKPGSLS